MELMQHKTSLHENTTRNKFGQPVIDHIQSMLRVKLKRKHRNTVNII